MSSIKAPVDTSGVIVAHKNMISKKNQISKFDHKVDAKEEYWKHKNLQDEAAFKSDIAGAQLVTSVTTLLTTLAKAVNPSGDTIKGASTIANSDTETLNKKSYTTGTADLSIAAPTSEIDTSLPHWSNVDSKFQGMDYNQAIEAGMSPSEAGALFGVDDGTGSSGDYFNVGGGLSDDDSIVIPALKNKVFKVNTDKNGNVTYEDITEFAIDDAEYAIRYGEGSTRNHLKIFGDKIKNIFGTGRFQPDGVYMIGGKQYTGTELHDIGVNPSGIDTSGVKADDAQLKGLLLNQYSDKISIDDTMPLRDIQRAVAGYEVTKVMFKGETDWEFDANGTLVSGTLSPELEKVKNWATGLDNSYSDKAMLEYLKTEFQEYDPVKIPDPGGSGMPDNTLQPYEVPVEGEDFHRDSATHPNISLINQKLDDLFTEATASVNDGYSSNPQLKKTPVQKQFDWMLATDKDNRMV
jgi:hypothetical protein